MKILAKIRDYFKILFSRFRNRKQETKATIPVINEKPKEPNTPADTQDSKTVSPDVLDLDRKLKELRAKQKQIGSVITSQNRKTDKDIEELKHILQNNDKKHNRKLSTSAIDELKNRFGQFDEFFKERELVLKYQRREAERAKEFKKFKKEIENRHIQVSQQIKQNNFHSAKSAIRELMVLLKSIDELAIKFLDKKSKEFVSNYFTKLEALNRELSSKEIEFEAKRQAEELKKLREEVERRRLEEEERRRQQREKAELIHRLLEGLIRRRPKEERRSFAEEVKREEERKERENRERILKEQKRQRLQAEAKRRKLEDEARREEERKERENRERFRREQELEKQQAEAEKRRLEEEERLRQEKENAAIALKLQENKKQKLHGLLTKKENWQQITYVLNENEISTLYHFTDRANIDSIKRHGGLFSWQYLREESITVPYEGGGSLSKELDSLYGLEDFVRVCFTKEHPMKYVAQKEGRIPNPVILEISTEVCEFKNTKFADMNATRTGHNSGTSLADLEKIKFEVVKQRNHFDLTEDDKPYYTICIYIAVQKWFAKI